MARKTLCHLCSAEAITSFVFKAFSQQPTKKGDNVSFFHLKKKEIKIVQKKKEKKKKVKLTIDG